eukprot:gnl/TRDRNA2_/TRDRNA2_136029_c0_seq2.p1 gnl/TRDRNA2_/TRDRNA2_136029_c0~~gnl/TRDRNA2_/TRDRNA2_136029_c0_seq2.p1  ORF type:complete len:242 (-),score=40.02 gnl/TRDRNA2_/TRDRNA2_136029_c0_seq2:253-978(-)
MSGVKFMDDDVPLSETGERQIAFKLTTKPKDFLACPVQRVYCSPMRRAIRTCLAAYPDYRVIIDPRLKEVSCTGGMNVHELTAFVAREQPSRSQGVEVARMPAKAWWGLEDDDDVRHRIQEIFEEIHEACSKGEIQRAALVCHSVLIRAMAGLPTVTFPKAWGSPRGWPKNFKPYFTRLERAADGDLRVIAAAPGEATVVLLRHAHSAAQAARTADKKEKKRKAAEAEALGSLRKKPTRRG